VKENKRADSYYKYGGVLEIQIIPYNFKIVPL
jgi:hypothetical protein